MTGLLREALGAAHQKQPSQITQGNLSSSFILLPAKNKQMSFPNTSEADGTEALPTILLTCFLELHQW